MTTRTTETELMQLEHKFWDAIKSGDAETTAAMTDSPTIVTSAQGAGEVDPEAMKGMMAQATWKLHGYEMSDTHVRQLGPDMAIVAYTVKEDITVDGQRFTLTAHDSSVWRREGGRWLCSLHTESLAGDPFGRDKR